ncbi:murein biosynthesis integral membrane protein MurJ [Allocatelliglobosispora scoriae]
MPAGEATVRLGVPAAAEATAPAGPTAASSSALMAAGSLVSRATGFLRTAMIAAALGGALLGVGDAYTTSQFLPGMVYELLIGGILASVVVPVLVQARKRDADGGEAYAQRLITLVMVVLGVASLLATLCAPLLTLLYTKPSTGDAYRALVTDLSYLMLPAIFFFGVAAILSAYLNTRNSFAPPMWTPILNNVIVIATAAAFMIVSGSTPVTPANITPGLILLLGGGTLLGIVVQTVALLPALHKAGFRWRLRFDFRELGLRRLGHLGGWVFCYVAVSQVGLLVLLRLLSGDGLLIYNNVFLLMMMAHGIVAVSIVTALMPRMSAAATAGRFADVVDDLAKGVRTTVAMLAPIAVVFIFLAGPTLVALFVRGEFTVGDADKGAPVLIMAGLSLIPFSLSQLFTFAFYALPDTKTPALLNIPVVVVRVAVQLVLFGVTAMGAAGVMLGNGISYLVCLVLSAWLLRNKIGSLGLAQTAGTLAKVAAAMVGSGLVGFGAVAGIEAIGIDSAWVQLIIGGGLILASYLGLAKLLRVGEIDDVFALLGRIRRKVVGR